MAAIVDDLKVVWDSKDRRYFCVGQGFAFCAWFAGTPAVVEAEVFDPKDSTRCVAVLETPAPGFPDEVPLEIEVAIAFSKQLRKLVAEGFPK